MAEVAPPRPHLAVQGLCKRFGALAAVDGLELSIARGTLHALIGPNGAGKSTALALIAGEQSADGGSIRFEGRDLTHLPVGKRARLGLQRSYQITSIFPDFTVLQNVAIAVQARQGRHFTLVRKAGGDRSLTDPALAVLTELGLAEQAGRPARDLAHGAQRQLELAMALAAGPSLLLLDEPMAGMSALETRSMAAILDGLRGRVTVLLVEHDMDVVFALSDQVSVMVKGRLLASGPPVAIRADPAVRAAYLGGDA